MLGLCQRNLLINSLFAAFRLRQLYLNFPLTLPQLSKGMLKLLSPFKLVGCCVVDGTDLGFQQLVCPSGLAEA